MYQIKTAYKIGGPQKYCQGPWFGTADDEIRELNGGDVGMD